MFAKPFAHSGVPSPRKNGETVQDGMTDGRVPKSCAYCHSGVPSPRKNGETAQDGMTDGREAKEERLAVYYCGKSTRGAPFCKTDGHAKKGTPWGASRPV